MICSQNAAGCVRRLKKICDNDLALKQMKRFFPTSLALLLVMGSLGHVFAAVFCPRMFGHDCCLTKASHQRHSSQSHQHMHHMALESDASDSMLMNGHDMEAMVNDDVDVSPSSRAIDDGSLLSTSGELAPANKFDVPIETCTHCMSHSGIQNAPLSSVSVSDQSNKDLGSVFCPVAKFHVRSRLTLSQIGLPREHSPPGSSAPRHILISVFLI